MSFAVLAIPEFDRDDADDENAGKSTERCVKSNFKLSAQDIHGALVRVRSGAAPAH